MNSQNRLLRWRNRIAQTPGSRLLDQTNRRLLVVLAGHALRLLLGLVSSALFARGLGPAGLSVFAVLGAAMSIGVTLSDFGLSQSAVRYIAGNLDGAPEQARDMARAFALLKVAGALTVGAVIILAADRLVVLLNLPPASGRALLVLLAAGIVATSLNGIISGVLQALSRFKALMLTQSLNAALTVLLAAPLFVAGVLTVPAALWVGILTTLAAMALGWRLLPAAWRGILFLRALSERAARELVGFSRWLALSSILMILAAQLDLLLLNHWAEPVAVGIYALALNLSFKAQFINQSLHLVLLPAASALKGDGYGAYVRQNLWRSALLGAPLLLILPLAHHLIPAIYGDPFMAAVPLFYGFMLLVLLDLLVDPVLLLAYPLDLAPMLAWTQGIRVGILLLVGLWLIPEWGPWGALVARALAKVTGATLLGVAIAFRVRRQGARA